MQPQYFGIQEMFRMIDEPNRSACQSILAENIKLFLQTQGSTNNHQTWRGGYFAHIQEVMNIAIVLFDTMNRLRPLPFSMSDALLILFLHDLEKPWRIKQAEDGTFISDPSLDSKAAHRQFRAAKMKEYGIKLTFEQANAILYVEGELADYSSKRRVMNELAAFCHLCDVTSARIWYNHPMEFDDPWQGAKRMR